jgi:hypothetical protein
VIVGRVSLEAAPPSACHDQAEAVSSLGIQGKPLLLLHKPDLSSENTSRRPERQFGLLQMVCCKGEQLFCHSQLGTRLGQSDAAFGYLSRVFGCKHSYRMATAIVSLNQNHRRRFKFDYHSTGRFRDGLCASSKVRATHKGSVIRAWDFHLGTRWRIIGAHPLLKSCSRFRRHIVLPALPESHTKIIFYPRSRVNGARAPCVRATWLALISKTLSAGAVFCGGVAFVITPSLADYYIVQEPTTKRCGIRPRASFEKQRCEFALPFIR